MADRKLVAMFPDAYRPLSIEEAHSFLCGAVERYGTLPATFFGLPVYQNPVGIELEVEAFDFSHMSSAPFYWNSAEDASLKKQGCELISVPLRGKNIDYALYELEDILQRQPGVEFSHRTSVHVHCNVSTFTLNQLKALMALYACAEEALFSFVADKRRGNTFCYRLVGTPAEVVFYKSDKEGEQCTKYCAFNIQPVRRQLTVEFRHLEGTGDIKRIRRWIQLCSKLVGYVSNMPAKTCIPTVLDLLEKGNLPSLYWEIWGDLAEALFTERQLEESVNNAALWSVALLTTE